MVCWGDVGEPQRGLQATVFGEQLGRPGTQNPSFFFFFRTLFIYF